MTGRAFLGAASVVVLGVTVGPAHQPGAAPAQIYGEVYPYDGAWTFVRV